MYKQSIQDSINSYRHIILYLKHHYKTENNKVNDIRTLISIRSNIDKKYISDTDIAANLLYCYEEIHELSIWTPIQILREIYNFKIYSKDATMFESFFIKLSSAIALTKMVGYDLGEIDPEILKTLRKNKEN